MEVDLFGQARPASRLDAYQIPPGGNRNGKDEWLTPPELIAALGPFDLDPCAPITRPWPTATRHLTIEDDGLRASWTGRVWLNPPYLHTAKWLARLADHGPGLALVFARVETRLWFDLVWPRATAVHFLRGRLNFHHIDGRRTPANSGAPSALIAYTPSEAEFLRSAPVPGWTVTP